MQTHAAQFQSSVQSFLRRAVQAVPAAVVGLLLIGTGPTPVEAGVINASSWSGVAIEGTDPVAYFTEGKAVEGKSDFSFDWQGATWRFASQANLDAFKGNPEKYAPQYGGYCAWAVSQGYTASIDPSAWHIENGKLYLNYSKGVQRNWAKDIPGHIAMADRNWPDIRAKLK